MPELHWRYGYTMFWALGLFFTASVLYWMHKTGILKSRSMHWAASLDSSVMEQELKRYPSTPPHLTLPIARERRAPSLSLVHSVRR